MKSIHFIVDMQFGSCGKGLFAGYLAQRVLPDTIITAWAPNAGHTFIDADGTEYVNIALPNGIVARPKRILLGPGSVINPQLLLSEMERYAHLLSDTDILIHEHASVVTENHRQQEAAYAYKLGSTMKGVGAAVIQKIRRDPDDLNVAGVALHGTPLEGLLVTTDEYNNAVDRAGVTVVEGAQGFSLSMNQGFYPYTTSRDCTVQQLMVDCGLPLAIPHYGRTVHGVCRTYPIRVANRYKDCPDCLVTFSNPCPTCGGSGKVQVGWSGPHYHDQDELQWSDLGMEPELTTVTRLPRRIFTFSMEQIRQAVRMNGIDNVFLNFANYPMLENRGNGAFGNGINSNTNTMIREINGTGATVRWLGYGPKVTDVKEL